MGALATAAPPMQRYLTPPQPGRPRAVPLNQDGSPDWSDLRSARRRHQPLVTDWQITDREKTVLEWVADGKSNRQIAKALRIREHYASTIVSRLCIARGVPNRAALVASALRSGVIQ